MAFLRWLVGVLLSAMAATTPQQLEIGYGIPRRREVEWRELNPKRHVEHYIENRNTRRLHSTLRYITPLDMLCDRQARGVVVTNAAAELAVASRAIQTLTESRTLKAAIRENHTSAQRSASAAVRRGG